MKCAKALLAPPLTEKSILIATATELNVRVSFPDDENILNKRNGENSISITATHRPHA